MRPFGILAACMRASLWRLKRSVGLQSASESRFGVDSVSSPAGALRAIVDRPDAPTVPAITVMGPSGIGACDTATIEVSNPLLLARSIISSAKTRFSDCFCPDAKSAGRMFLWGFFQCRWRRAEIERYFCEVHRNLRLDLPGKRLLTRVCGTFTNQAAALSPRACTFKYSCT